VPPNAVRPPYPHERPLLETLFELAGLSLSTSSVLVESMEDGGMGSLAFAPLGRRFGGSVSECQFTDADGILVHAALNLGDEGKPLELDVWKVNFEPLLRWPVQEELVRLFSEGRPAASKH
jgi:hypothetical protein